MLKKLNKIIQVLDYRFYFKEKRCVKNLHMQCIDNSPSEHEHFNYPK